MLIVDQGRYYKPEELDIRDGNITVYVAKGTHVYIVYWFHIKNIQFWNRLFSTIEKGLYNTRGDTNR